MKRHVRDERGFAMVMGLLVTFVVLLLSVSVIAMAIHDVESSHYDRRRLFAVVAAETGVNQMYMQLESTSPSAMKCYLTGSVTSGPSQGSYEAQLQIYSSNAANATPISAAATAQSPSCSLPATLPTALYGRITSMGQAPAQTMLRRMESYVRITPRYGGFGAAVLATASTTVSNKFTVEGADGDDGDIYISCPTGTAVTACTLTLSNNQSINGNVYAMGNVTVGGSVVIDGDLHALGSITMSNSSRVMGDAISSTSSISVSSPAVVEGNATAFTTVTPNTSYSARIKGLVVTGVRSPDPPTQQLPTISLSATEQAAWNAAGYEIKTFTGSGTTPCTNAKSFITSPAGPAGTSIQNTNVHGTKNWVVWVNNAASAQGCAMSFSSQTISIPGNLAVVVDKGVSLTASAGGAISTWNYTTFQAVGGDRNLFFIVRNYGQTCGTSSAWDISTSNNTNFVNVAESPTLSITMYTPCRVRISNQNLFNGQILGQFVDIANQTTINYTPTLVPGAGQIIGFRQDVQFLREIPA